MAEDPESAWLTKPFPPGVHTRPEGSGDSQTILMLWDYREKATDTGLAAGVRRGLSRNRAARPGRYVAWHAGLTSIKCRARN